MERHAAECTECRALVENIGKLTERLSRLPKLEPSAGFQFALRSHLLMDEAKTDGLRNRVRRVFFPSVQRTVLSAAAVVILGLGLATVLDESGGVIEQAGGPQDSQVTSKNDPVVTVDHRSALKRVPGEGSYRLSSRHLSDQIQPDSTKLAQPDAKRPDDGIRRVIVSF